MGSIMQKKRLENELCMLWGEKSQLIIILRVSSMEKLRPSYLKSGSIARGINSFNPFRDSPKFIDMRSCPWRVHHHQVCAGAHQPIHPTKEHVIDYLASGEPWTAIKEEHVSYASIKYLCTGTCKCTIYMQESKLVKIQQLCDGSHAIRPAVCKPV